MINSQKNTGIFFYLFLLTSLFALIEISYFVMLKNGYLAKLNLLTDQFHIPPGILYGLLSLIISQIVIHLFFCLTLWIVVLTIGNYFQLTNNARFNLAIILWGISILTVIIANVYYFPNSSFSELFYVLLPNRTLIFILLNILFFIISGIGLITLFSLLVQLHKKITSIYFKLIIFFICLISFITYFQNTPFPIVDASTKEKPNIILVGIDSLRPDFLSYFGYGKVTPFLDSFLEEATVFSEAVTPLARTFPSWTSILTGQYPKQHGARTNLVQQQNLNLSGALPRILQKNGYDTIYASDEARFSNIDHNFGFKQVITPPMGINDFLIGTFNDFPLSNFLINTALGSWLFPYNYANRPNYATYDPDSFLKRLSSAIYKPRAKPLFLAVHFCLPHHPYSWKDLPDNDLTIRELYQASIGRVDKQLADFFILMKKNHMLDNAIVVLLSDHGEALELQGDRITEKELFLSTQQPSFIPMFYPAKLNHEALNRSSGHGTDVLGLSQYHTVLAFKGYGDKKQHIGMLNGVVTLLSIQPTILEWIGLALPHSDAKSLFNVIHGKERVNSVISHVFLESDFSPNAILSIRPDIQEVLLEGMKIFQVDPITMRLTVKNEMYKMIIDSKQYADIYGEWMLALYPQANHLHMPILINLRSGLWTNDLRSPFAKHSPIVNMLAELKRFYRNEINMKKFAL